MAEPTHIADVLAALGFLGPDAMLTITVRADDLRGALEAKGGGPQIMTAEQAAQWHGRTAEYWRRAAKRGAVAGAYQDAAAGPWRLPREACAAHLRNRQARRATTRHEADVTPLFGGAAARGPRRKPAA